MEGPRRTLPQYLGGARWALRSRWANHPSYLAWSRHRGERAIVDRDTELVIEAYMRSANTFSVVAFQMAQPRPVRLAHHLHAPAQIVAAARMGVPALTIVRAPGDAAASVTIRSPQVTLENALRAYVRFHQPLLAVGDACVVARFEDVTDDLGAVVERVNARFGTAFTPFEHTEANVQAVYAMIEERSARPPWAPAIRAYVSGQLSREALQAAREGGGPVAAAVPETRVARPSADRRERARQVKERYASPALAGLRARAEDAYRALLERA